MEITRNGICKQCDTNSILLRRNYNRKFVSSIYINLTVESQKVQEVNNYSIYCKHTERKLVI